MTKKAFTLIETIMVIALTALISLTLGTLIVYFYKTDAYAIEQSTAVAQARRGVEDAMRYLREASYGSDGSYPIQSVATSSITFYANVDSDAVIERISYSLIKRVLYRTVTQPAGNPPVYTGAVSTSTIATPVVNAPGTPIFRYFDGNGVELASPVNISKIASVSTTVVIDTNLARAPVSFTLSGGATLRNLREQL